MLGDAVRIDSDKTKIHVDAKLPFSKRYLKVWARANSPCAAATARAARVLRTARLALRPPTRTRGARSHTHSRAWQSCGRTHTRTRINRGHVWLARTHTHTHTHIHSFVRLTAC